MGIAYIVQVQMQLNMRPVAARNKLLLVAGSGLVCLHFFGCTITTAYNLFNVQVTISVVFFQNLTMNIFI